MTMLPNDLSIFQSLIVLDLSKNNFKNYEEIGKALATIPNLKELKIDLFSQDDAYYILSNLPRLDYLNEKKTKESQSPIDINDQEMENTSLKNEIPNFNSLTKRIIAKLQMLNQSTDLFYSQFQQMFKGQIDNLQNLSENVPNYLYASHVLNAKVEIYSFLQNKCINMLSAKVDSELVDIIKTINHFIKLNETYSIELIQKISSNFEKAIIEYKSTSEEKDQKINELYTKNQQIENQIVSKDKMISQLKEQNKQLNDKVDELTTKQNLMVTQSNNNIKTNPSAKVTPIKRNNITITTNNNINTNSSIKSVKKTTLQNSQNTSQISQAPSIVSKKDSRALIGPINKRSITIKNLLETINEIYQSKRAHDKKLQESGLQKETLEQHMYTYLNYKYGLKNLVIEWASAIIDGIRKYSRENSEICLFGKILRNEIEEGEILIITKLKATINSFLVYYIQNKYTLKTKGEIDQIVNSIKVGYLNEEEWKNITSYLFPNENDLLALNDKITNFILKANNNNLSEEKISYQKFIQIIIEFQIRLRDIYLKHFNEMFIKVDTNRDGIINEGEFYQLIEGINVYDQDNVDQQVNAFLSYIDPYKTGNILYSDVIDLLSKEMIMDKDPDTDELVKMSILDKLSIQYE